MAQFGSGTKRKYNGGLLKMIDKAQAQQNGFKTISSNDVITNDKNKKLEQLKKLIPNLINSDNQVDTNALQDFIDIAQTTSNNKGYELTFAGKGIARAKADSETNFELKFEPSQSKNVDIVGTDLCVCPDKNGQTNQNRQTNQNEQGQTHRFVPTENVVIRGDNLEVLKILKQNYFGKIKMIYIDPPYNTKNENFIYNDNFKESESDLLKTFGFEEEEFEENETLNFLHNVYGTRSHSGWLAFMYPRLKLARDLLKEDGVIFISIDDNEVANLRIICDEIFGEQNFVGQPIRRTINSGKHDVKTIAVFHEHLLIYAKNNDNLIFNKLQHSQKNKEKLYKLKDSFLEVRGYHYITQLNKSSIRYSDSLNYPIIAPDGLEIYPGQDLKDKKWCWRWSREKVDWGIKNNFIVFKKDATNKYKIYTKSYEKVDNECNPIDRGNPYSSLEFIKKEYANFNATPELANIFNGLKFFDFPKPTLFIKELIKILNTNPKDIILDFFAGSGTTGDAVMQLNAEDGGDRKFILVQWDEAIKENTEAYKFCTENNFKPVISSITLERLNRAGDKIVGTTENQKPLFEIGTVKNKSVDIGYKVFSLTEKPKIIEAKDENQKEIFKVVNERTETINILINMMCATCKPLHSKIEELIKDKLYKVNDEIYLLGEVEKEQLEPYKDSKINIDGWSDISLENWLNLEVGQKENIMVVY